MSTIKEDQHLLESIISTYGKSDVLKYINKLNENTSSDVLESFNLHINLFQKFLDKCKDPKAFEYVSNNSQNYTNMINKFESYLKKISDDLRYMIRVEDEKKQMQGPKDKFN